MPVIIKKSANKYSHSGTLPPISKIEQGPAGEPPKDAIYYSQLHKSPSLSDQLIAWLEALKVREGARTGENLVVLPWQQDFLHGAFGPDVDEAALSIARAAGKTTLLGAVALATVVEDGPLHRPNQETIIVASALEQARILFRHTLNFGGDILADRKKFRILDSTQRSAIINRKTGASVKALGSDPRRLHGLAPRLILCDEPAQWPPGDGDRMFAALKTSRGKQPDSVIVLLGTRPRDQLHFFSRMLNSQSSTRYVQLHAADDLDDFLNPNQWAMANPSLIHFPDLRKIVQSEAKDAADDPGLLAMFRALRLNGGTSETDNRDMLVSAELWRELLDQPDAPATGRRTWGIDAGGAQAMSAVACCWDTGRLEVLGMFGSNPTLEKRAVQDGAGDLYNLARDSGELLVSGKRIPDIAALFDRAAAKFGGRPDKIIVDRWRVDELRDALDDRSWEAIELVTRGAGYKDGGEDVRNWRYAAVDRWINPAKPSVLLTSALAEATTMMDPAGNEKLCISSEGGRRKRSRDDAAAAAVLAVSHAFKGPDQQTGGLTYGGII